MKKSNSCKFAVLTAVFLLLISFHSDAQKKTGIFDGNSDVGAVLHAGSAKYDTVSQQYELSGAGTNIWFTGDQFHYLCKKMTGDFIVQASGHLVGKGVELHRKYGWMIRSTTDSSSPMVCATVHGDGLTSLQYRKEKAVNVEEVKSSVSTPDFIQLERRGNQYIMSVAHQGDTLNTVQTSDVDLGNDVYVGLFVCSHNKDVLESVRFNNVRIIVPTTTGFVPYKDYLGSHIELLDVTTGNRKILYSSPVSLQAPNWSHDGSQLIYNSNGLMYTLNLTNPSPSVLSTGEVKGNNNDHVLSFDGNMLGLSSSTGNDNSQVFTVPVTGGKPKQITTASPSYLHGWSPDKKYLLFTGERNKEFDIYRIPSAGGKEERLTTAQGLDDGSEYSPDGKFIYFNSVRSGTMQIWRMNADGSNQEQLTNDEYNNWFPHVSPDGQLIVFISFMKDVNPSDHPFYKHVYIRIMPLNGGKPQVVAYVYGGQGSMNTPSWSPDSKRIAFVSNSDKIE